MEGRILLLLLLWYYGKRRQTKKKQNKTGIKSLGWYNNIISFYHHPCKLSCTDFSLRFLEKHMMQFNQWYSVPFSFVCEFFFCTHTWQNENCKHVCWYEKNKIIMCFNIQLWFTRTTVFRIYHLQFVYY